jgi:phenylalanyl-tRNA synthetase beta chain
MKVPLSWIKDYVDIELEIEELAHELTMAGLEVEEIIFVGLPKPGGKIEITSNEKSRQETKISGIEWDADKIVVGAILEVMPHPNADRLVLCRLEDNQKEHIVLTGAPNLFPYKGQGPIDEPLKVAYAREGASLYDGHQSDQVMMTLERTKIRGVESFSMACSEKELGISDYHEGVIILDKDAPVGAPLVDYMGDAVFDIDITPNIARDANILGIAREIAAITGKKLRPLLMDTPMEGPAIGGKVSIEIRDPTLNPRFVLGLIENIEICPSPYEVQRRLHLAGMRPINNIVDATNYAMLETGEPLHAFDYDFLKNRAQGDPVKIITRTADPSEVLTTLDGVEHHLDDFTVLVCDSAGALSIAGVMGGAESEVNEHTSNVLLEGAAWNFTNIRRTLSAQRMSSEAAYRFSRGVHPALAELGVRRGLDLMRLWSGGVVADGLVDNYPLPPDDPKVEFTTQDVQRWLGISLETDQIADILTRLEFTVDANGNQLSVKTPPHRLDISQGTVGIADIMEEIARIYGYDQIPETRLSGSLPPQHGNATLDLEEKIRDLLVNLGLQEIITHRLTAPDKEARVYSDPDRDEPSHIRIANPISSDRIVLRQSLLASVLNIGEQNSRLSNRLALFEIGEVFLLKEGEIFPQEPRKLAILLGGLRGLPHWQGADEQGMDFYDLKGIISDLVDGLHIGDIIFEQAEQPSFHPGKCSLVMHKDENIGVFGEIHPLVKDNYDLPDFPILVAELDMEIISHLVPDRYQLEPVPKFPPVLEDLAIVVDEHLQVEKILDVIQATGGDTVAEIQLFDVYRGGQAGEGKKSLAFNLKYQKPDRTLTDEEVSGIRKKIIKQLDQKLGAKLRS